MKQSNEKNNHFKWQEITLISCILIGLVGFLAVATIYSGNRDLIKANKVADVLWVIFGSMFYYGFMSFSLYRAYIWFNKRKNDKNEKN